MLKKFNKKQKLLNKKVLRCLFYPILKTVIILWFTTIGYLVYVLNDIGVIEEINTNTQEISNVETIDSSYIINGDNYGENKTNQN